MDDMMERPPPSQYIKIEVGNGEKRIMLSWFPKSGILQFSRLGSEGNAMAISKKFKTLEAATVSDVVLRMDEFLASVLDDEDAIAAAKRMVSGMMSILPGGKEKERES